MRKLSLILLAVFITGIIVAVPVLAAGYSYEITLTEANGNSYTNTPFIATVNNTGLVSQGYLSSTGLDGIVKDGGTSLPTMVANDKVLFVDNLNANQSKTVQYTTGNSLLTSMPIIVGNGGYITTPYNADLELGLGFELDISGYVDTTSGVDKYILFKDGEATIQVTGTGEITATVNDGSDESVVLAGITSGYYAMSLILDSGALTFTVGAHTDNAACGTPTNNTNNWIWDENNVMPYVTSIKLSIINYGTYNLGNEGYSAPEWVSDYGGTTLFNVGGYVAATSGKAESMSVRVSALGYNTNYMRMALYTETGGTYAPVTNGVTDPVQIPQGEATDWITATFPVQPDIVQDTTYYLLYREDSLWSYKVGYYISDFSFVGTADIDYSSWGTFSSPAQVFTNYQPSLYATISYATSSTEVLNYQPNAIILGTVLPDLDGNEDGIIEWGTNPSGVTITVGGLTPTAPTVYGSGNYAAFDGNDPGAFDMPNPVAPPQLYTELDASKIPGGGVINELLNEGGVPQALWWFPFIFIGVVIIGMLVYDATQRTGGQGSLLAMCLTILIGLVIFGVMGVTGVSGMIPLWTALLFPIPAAALILSRRHVGWG